MLRFQIEETELYFYRLSVLPICQRQGVAKSLLNHLEDYCMKHQISKIKCKVRANIWKTLISINKVVTIFISKNKSIKIPHIR